MAACPVALTPLARRRPLVLTRRRLEANRRNARLSTGPRTAQGKARVARNTIKHGFFAAQQRWTPEQHREFAALLEGLRDDLRPEGALEDGCVRTMAESYVRMAAALRYENIAALKHHERLDRALDAQIMAAAPPEAARLEATRTQLRSAGLWAPTILGEREAIAIMRYLGRLDRTLHGAAMQLDAMRSLRRGGVSSSGKVQKQTHFPAAPGSGPEALRRASAQRFDDSATPNSGPDAAEVTEGPSTPSSAETKNAKTNPLSSTFAGNRHQRRRAKAMAWRR